MYRACEDGVIEGHIGVALDLDCDDENLNNLILNMRDELKNRVEEQGRVTRKRHTISQEAKNETRGI